ncbi:hypothetical protein L914_00214 [Phytophthora nicotianae]|uniref:RxLR effector protein n=1 Tax=Phytophthora nicotianae TaxID=4792 RepID=W2P7F0_PHYNI|nr:hypothetical protein L914_00214 [Phytophthora nicotianae]
MRNSVLLFALAFVIFACGNALTATEDGIQLKMPQSELHQAAQWNVGGKRLLRANDGTNADEEERGMAEFTTKMKTWAQSFKTWVTNSKLVQMANTKFQSLSQKWRISNVEQMIRKGVSDTVLFEKKVTPDEYFLALKLDPKLKLVSDSQVIREQNPGLLKFFAYTDYYNTKIVAV